MFPAGLQSHGTKGSPGPLFPNPLASSSDIPLDCIFERLDIYPFGTFSTTRLTGMRIWQ
jgi:hypothetical protein